METRWKIKAKLNSSNSTLLFACHLFFQNPSRSVILSHRAGPFLLVLQDARSHSARRFETSRAEVYRESGTDNESGNLALIMSTSHRDTNNHVRVTRIISIFHLIQNLKEG